MSGGEEEDDFLAALGGGFDDEDAGAPGEPRAADPADVPELISKFAASVGKGDAEGIARYACALGGNPLDCTKADLVATARAPTASPAC